MIHTQFTPDMVSSFQSVVTEHFVFVLWDTDSLPKYLTTPSLLRVIELKKQTKKGYSLRLDAFSENIETVHILGLDSKENISSQIAEYVRALKGWITLAVSESVNTSAATEAFGLWVYCFQAYLTEKKIRKFQILSEWSSDIDQSVERVNAVYLARDLVNMPPNEKFPQKLVALVESLPWKNTKIRVLGKKELEKAGFWMLLAVSAGSDNEPQVMIFERIAKNESPKYAFVGKGVTFDSGGIQIKPDDAMLEMKMDMAGAAAVIATMWHLDSLNDIPHGIVGAIWLVENMTGGSAAKPLDIVRAHNGLTVEIHHTDAEGRLVLGDLVSYISQEYKPTNAVTIATLTGACIYALGFDYAGVMWTTDVLVDTLFENSKKLPEKLWKLPVDTKMLEATKATIADRKNLTKSMKAGSSMGAAFIAQFVPENVAYAHLDIAGPAYRDKADGIFPSEATGFGFYTLSNLAK